MSCLETRVTRDLKASKTYRVALYVYTMANKLCRLVLHKHYSPDLPSIDEVSSNFLASVYEMNYYEDYTARRSVEAFRREAEQKAQHQQETSQRDAEHAAQRARWAHDCRQRVGKLQSMAESRQAQQAAQRREAEARDRSEEVRFQNELAKRTASRHEQEKSKNAHLVLDVAEQFVGLGGRRRRH